MLKAIMILPFNASITIPLLIGWLSGQWSVPTVNSAWTWVGVGLLALGLVLFVWTVTLFVRIGKGSLAPWDPTCKLVVAGPYAFVRHPMITGVTLVIAGEATLMQAWPIGVWAGVFLVGNAIYLPLKEEPGLVARFGDEYIEYRQHVPALIPRPTPWKPTAEQG